MCIYSFNNTYEHTHTHIYIFKYAGIPIYLVFQKYISIKIIQWKPTSTY